MPVPPQLLLDFWRVPLNPAVNGSVIDVHAPVTKIPPLMGGICSTIIPSE